MQTIDKAINALGENISFQGTAGKAVIYPVRAQSRENGGNGEAAEGAFEPHRFYLIGTAQLLHSARMGDIVSKGTDEYYVLWNDTLTSSIGSYCKLCVRLCEGSDVV